MLDGLEGAHGNEDVPRLLVCVADSTNLRLALRLVLELKHVDRKRIFNLGYFTWVEQQGVTLDAFDRRKEPRFWRGLVDSIPAWDRMIDEFNAEVGAERVHAAS